MLNRTPLPCLLASAAALLIAPVPAAQAQSGPPIIVPEPVARSGPDSARSSTVLMAPDASAACDGERIVPMIVADIPPSLYGATFRRGQSGQRIGVAALSFRLDAGGRPFDIRSAPSGADGVTDDLNPTVLHLAEAAFAGWRFPEGEKAGCRLTLRYTPVPVDRAEPPLLARYFAVTRTSGPAREAVEARLRGTDQDCGEDRPARRAAFPDFDAGAPRPGVQDWTIVRFDIDAEGRATDITTLDSSGDEGFDAEARRSTAHLLVAPGSPRFSCIYNWYRRGAVLPAPPVPEPPRDLLAACPRAVLNTFRPGETGNEVSAFRARGIEGWALVRFDIAPWGEVGNVEVIEAQPASGIGDEAKRIVSAGRADAGAGAIRCVQPVIFRVPAQR